MERPKILVVEDEQIVATELKERLHALGYRVAGAASDRSGGYTKTENLNPRSHS